MWKAGETPRRVPKPITTPKALRLPAHRKPPTIVKRVPTILDDHNITEVLAQADAWSQEADKLEETIEDKASAPEQKLPTTEIRLGLLFVNLERAKGLTAKQTLDDHVRAWDKNGDGMISKGEFRLHVRELGMTEVDVKEIDNMFDRYDEDRSGKMEIAELKWALRRMKRAANAHYYGHEIRDSLQRQVDALRTRASNVREAVECAERVANGREELMALKLNFGERIDLQLGELLIKRGISVGEMIGSWPKARSREQLAHTRELSKAEWKDEITALGLQVRDSAGKQRAVTRKELGQLFDEIDLDNSGWLDLKEAKQALTKWREQSLQHDKALAAKEKELMRMKRRASRLLQGAMRGTQSPQKLPEPGSPGSDSMASPGSSFAPSPGSPGTDPPESPPRSSSRFWNRAAMQEREAKQAKRQAAKDKANTAIMHMRQREIAFAWAAWQHFWVTRRESLQRCGVAVDAFLTHALAYGFRTWGAQHHELLQQRKFLSHAVRRFKRTQNDCLRGWDAWLEWMVQLQERGAWMERMLHVVQEVQNRCRVRPRLYFSWWRTDAVRRHGKALPADDLEGALSSKPSSHSALTTQSVTINPLHDELFKLFDKVSGCVQPSNGAFRCIPRRAAQRS